MNLARQKNNLLQQNKLTPEGWVFLVVLTFITVGAIMRNVNLLVLMAGMMFVSLLINWRLARHRLTTITAKRRMPRRIHARELINIIWLGDNQSTRVPAWNLVVKDRVQRVDEDEQANDVVETYTELASETFLSALFGEILERFGKRKPNQRASEVGVCFPIIPAGQSEVQTYRTYFGKRGKYTIGPAVLSTTFPFGLIVSRFQYPTVETFFVGPELGVLEPTWEQRIQSIAAGSETIKRRRALEEDEFYALRPWRSGDAKKNIHWRTSAKVGHPIVKQYDQQNNRDFAMVLDLLKTDLGNESGDVERCELAIQFAATALASIQYAVQGQVTLGICGEQTDICSSRTQLGIQSDANRSLAVAHAGPDPETFPTIVRVAQMVSNGTPVYVISSRPKPEVIDPRYWANDEKLKANEERLRYRGLKQLLHLIRWLHVDSPEFEKMFSKKQNDQQVVNVAEKWLDHRKVRPANTQRASDDSEAEPKASSDNESPNNEDQVAAV